MRRIFLWVILLVMLAAAGFGFHVYRPLPLPAAPFEFALKQGSSLKSAARQLKQAGLLEQDLTFVWLGRMKGKSGTIKAGNYVLEHPVSRLELLKIIAEGNVSQSQISVIEGWTFKQLRAALDASPNLAHRTSGWSDAEILQRIGAAENHPEGLFFPTPITSPPAAATTIYRVAYHVMQRRLQEAWAAREAGLPLKRPIRP